MGWPKRGSFGEQAPAETLDDPREGIEGKQIAPIGQDVGAESDGG